MSDTRYWKIRDFVESKMKKGAFPTHYADLISALDGSEQDNFYLGMIVQELVLHGKLAWDIKRNLRILEESEKNG